MRIAGLVVLLVLTATTLVAADPRVAEQRRRFPARTELFIEVPLDRYSTDVIFPFGGSHHTVPGVVAVNHAPYFCVPHARAFRERAAFVTHLRTKHDLMDIEIPESVLVDGGQVRYIGD